MTQLEVLYVKPMARILWNNNKLFLADFLPNDAPKLSFHHIEQCQEVAIIADTPCTGAQLISNMMLLLHKSGISQCVSLRIGRLYKTRRGPFEDLCT
jgi:hypothetical protein